MRNTICLLSCLALLAGCPTASRPPEAPPDAAVAPPPADAPAAAPAAGDAPASAVMATINGRPIYMDRLVEPLVTVHGPRLAEMIVVQSLVSAEAEKRGIRAAAADIAAEHQRSLEGVFGGDVATAERVLDQLLRQRGLTRDLWNATMRQNALLRKMVADKTKVSEDLLKTEYARQFGDKVQVRHIQVPDINKAEQVIRQLKAGKDFAELARKESTNTVTAAQDGLLSAFTADDASYPQAIRDAAFALVAPGDVSGIVQVQNDFHVLRLEGKAATARQPFETVRGQLEAALRERLIQHAQAQLMADLRRSAVVEYVDPVLRQAIVQQRSEQDVQP